jgi:predicted RNase H-like HicB family nuclease
MTRRFTAHLWREGDLWVAQCLQVDVASQGETGEEALANLEEALELFLGTLRSVLRQAGLIPEEFGVL